MSGTGIQPSAEAGATAASRATEQPPRSIGRRASSIQIRLAESEADIEKLIALGPRFIEESRYRGLPFDAEKLRQAGRRALANKGQFGVLMAMKGDEVVGLLLAIVSEYFFSTELVAATTFFYVTPEHRGGMAAIKLLHGFRNWARNRKVREINVHITSGVHLARTDRLMRRLGFRFIGGTYAMPVVATGK